MSEIFGGDDGPSDEQLKFQKEQSDQLKQLKQTQETKKQQLNSQRIQALRGRFGNVSDTDPAAIGTGADDDKSTAGSLFSRLTGNLSDLLG